MATQSLYRRYRPRRFSEVKGQDHVVQALRNAVSEGREGQAYLFSGPRGTGKTTSARILAKVLNCTNVQNGEPCCECDSCLAVERGTSYDVHELDAASNNGVEAMRDLIEKASLGTPGRHKVYILDEVHMLSKPAEAALLKTLEEPPSHVVFVLATTDPQKMSDTIRSRTQHLQFHLVGSDTMQDHVRWVAAEAGLDVTDDALAQVLTQGAGSPRDTLSALELVANSGGRGAETVPLADFVEAMIDRDAGRALSATAAAISLGRDPRTLTEELIGYLRNGFLSIMAPDLVLLPAGQLEAVTDVARRLGAAGLVRGIEQLGEALTEMRHAPDPRVLLDVAIVRLTSDAASTDVAALAARVTQLEHAVAAGTPTAVAPVTAAPAAASAAAVAPPVDPTTGRARLGGRARRTDSAARPAATQSAADAPIEAVATQPAADAPTEAATSSGSTSAVPNADVPPVPTSDGERDAEPVPAADTPARVGAPGHPESTTAHAAPTPDVSDSSGVSRQLWEDTVKPGLRGMARAVFSPATFVGCDATTLTLSLPNDTHRNKCEQHRDAVEAALAAVAGGPVAVELRVDGGGGDASGGGRAPTTEAAPSGSAPVAASEPASPSAPGAAEARPTPPPPVDVLPPEDHQPDAAVYVLPADDEVDLSDLVDAPPAEVKTPIDRLADAFPGSELVEDTY